MMPMPFDAEAAFILPLVFELDRPAVLASAAGSTALQETLPYVPGASLLGALARRWRHANPGVAPRTSDQFRRLFVSGAVRFLNAYPEHPDSPGRRLLPVPRSMRRVKGTSNLRDLAAGEPSDDESLVGAADRATFCAPSAEQLLRASTQLRLAYHMARPDRARGRATEAPQAAGQLFTYEAVEAGQKFVGAALGAPEELDQLRDLLQAEGEPLRLGRSATAEYGGAPRFDAPLPEAIPFRSERVTTEDGEIEPQLEPGRLVLTLTSPLLAADRWGSPTLDFPEAQLQAALRSVGWLGELAKLRLRDRFQASEPVGGFSDLWQLPRPTWPAIAAGSVFVFESDELAPKPDDAGALAALEWHSLGLRTAEGFGRFVVGLHGARGSEILFSGEFPSAEIDRPHGDVPEAVQKLAAEITAAERLDLVRQQAVLRAQRVKDLPSGALLGRLSELARLASDAAGFGQAGAVLGALPRPAKDALQGCRIREGPGGLNATLLEHLQTVLNPDGDWQATALSGTEAATELQAIEARRQTLGLAPRPDAKALLGERRVYLLTLVAELRLRQRR
ncbi:MAG: hypothetical protein HY690_04345 [Chloroflexi bacterium]|nr:hypothetical protein [Chloroflexota bacterium]